MESKINKFGFWRVNNNNFYNKIDAFIYASKNNNFKIDFHYHDDAWNSYNRNLIGSLDLKNLYKTRAQQIREKYDYLILNYSGGADSHNVLLSFLNNNIKLDAVYIKWPIRASEAHQDSFDNSPMNLLSEWNLTITKRLKWLENNFPEVKIIIDDWSQNIKLNEFVDAENLYQYMHLYSLGDLSRIATRSKIEKELIDKNKTVGSIWGIDKPEVSLDQNDNLYFSFRDYPISVAQPLNLNVEGTELFYWSPEFPEIIFEQSQKILNFLRNNKEYRDLFRSIGTENIEEIKWKYKVQTDLIKLIVYDNWDPLIFQANKDFSPSKLQWDYWIYKSSEFSTIVNKWKHSFNNLVDNIDDSLILKWKDQKLGLWFCTTKKFFVGKI
jgi:hypothetical protein